MVGNMSWGVDTLVEGVEGSVDRDLDKFTKPKKF